LRADEVQPLLQPVALHGAGRGGELLLRHPVRDVLQQGGDLGQERAVVELESRDVALGVDGGVVLSAGGLASEQVDADQVDGEAGLPQGDVGCEGTGTGSMIELHGLDLRSRGRRPSDGRPVAGWRDNAALDPPQLGGEGRGAEADGEGEVEKDPMSGSLRDRVVGEVEQVRAIPYLFPGPADATSVLRDGYGTCASKHALLAERLALLGVESAPLLVVG